MKSNLSWGLSKLKTCRIPLSLCVASDQTSEDVFSKDFALKLALDRFHFAVFPTCLNTLLIALWDGDVVDRVRGPWSEKEVSEFSFSCWTRGLDSWETCTLVSHRDHEKRRTRRKESKWCVAWRISNNIQSSFSHGEHVEIGSIWNPVVKSRSKFPSHISSSWK